MLGSITAVLGGTACSGGTTAVTAPKPITFGDRFPGKDGTSLPACHPAPARPVPRGALAVGWTDNGTTVSAHIGERIAVRLQCGDNNPAIRTAVYNEVPAVLTTLDSAGDTAGNGWADLIATHAGVGSLMAVDACSDGGCTAGGWRVVVKVVGQIRTGRHAPRRPPAQATT